MSREAAATFKYLGLLGTSKPLVAPPADLERFREKLDRELKSGVVSLLLLLAIERSGPDYGYRILRNIQEWSGGRLAFKEGTAYPLLANLEKSGLVTSYWGNGEGGPPRKYYQTTTLGRAALKAALADWAELTDSIRETLKNADGGTRK